MNELERMEGRLREASSFDDMGQIIVELAAARVGTSGLNFMLFSGRVAVDQWYCWSSSFPPEFMQSRTLDAFPLADAELGSINEIAAQSPQCFYTNPVYARRRSLYRTQTYNEYWRPCGIEHQLLAFLGARGQPWGFFCVTRSSKERPFNDDDVAAIDVLRCAVQQVAGVARLDDGDVAIAILDALAMDLSLNTVAFTATGKALFDRFRAV
ncbi:MAG: hypothetical protein ACOC1F_11295 [Myxococcota bacterium]